MENPADSAIARSGLNLGDDLLQYVTAVGEDIATKRLEFTFPNGFGASVVKGAFTFGGRDGLFEVGILKDGILLTDHIYGRLLPERVVELLQIILTFDPNSEEITT